MSASRLLVFCFVSLSFALALRAEPTPAKRAVARETRAEQEEPGITFNSVHLDGPYIAMTFDDGPSATLTPKLLDLLAAHHIKATFFVIGENVAEHPEIVARAASEGHEIASHSWSHPNFAKMWTKVFAANSSKPMMQLRTPRGSVPPLCGRLMDRSQCGRSAGFMMNSVTTSFFGTWIPMTGNGQARRWSELAFLRRRGPARSCYLTTFIRERLRRCLPLLISSRQKDSNSSRYRN